LCQFQQTQNKNDKTECGHELMSVPKKYQTITLSRMAMTTCHSSDTDFISSLGWVWVHTLYSVPNFSKRTQNLGPEFLLYFWKEQEKSVMVSTGIQETDINKNVPSIPIHVATSL
jgi:hypothetical protein